jgi:hypothetical protein
MSAESAATLQEGLALAHWTITDLWVASVGIGGSFARTDVEHITAGTRTATQAEHDILAAAVNDHLTEQGLDQPVDYWHDL